MKQVSWCIAAAFLACSILFGQVNAETSHNELAEVKSKTVDQLFIKPDSNFSRYDSLLLEEAEISFRRGVYDSYPGSRIHARKAVDKSSNMLKQLFKDTFTEVITEAGDLTLVETDGKNVLRIRPKLTKVYLSYLEGMDSIPSPTKIYAKSAGEITLVLELYDSISGEVQARIVDKREATEWGDFMRQTSIDTRRESRKMIKHWAKKLNDGLTGSTLFTPEK